MAQVSAWVNWSRRLPVLGPFLLLLPWLVTVPTACWHNDSDTQYARHASTSRARTGTSRTSSTSSSTSGTRSGRALPLRCARHLGMRDHSLTFLWLLLPLHLHLHLPMLGCHLLLLRLSRGLGFWSLPHFCLHTMLATASSPRFTLLRWTWSFLNLLSFCGSANNAAPDWGPQWANFVRHAGPPASAFKDSSRKRAALSPSYRSKKKLRCAPWMRRTSKTSLCRLPLFPDRDSAGLGETTSPIT
mgnify:CR=1 FL=1